MLGKIQTQGARAPGAVVGSFKPSSSWNMGVRPLSVAQGVKRSGAELQPASNLDWSTIPSYPTERSRFESPRAADLEGIASESGADVLEDDDAGPGLAPAAPAPAPAGPMVPGPAPVPAAPGPPGPAAPPASPAPLTARVPNRVRAPSTPAAIGQDRIPPRVDTPVSVEVAGWHAPLLPVQVSVEGAGGGNGSVTINGSNSVDLTATTALQLRGVDQTDVGKAGNLRLVAKLGSTELASSAGFSVSAIPQNWSVAFNSLLTGTKRGIRVNNSWESDSGNLGDLDQAERSEVVEYDAGTGSLAGRGAGAHNSGYLPANNSPLSDSHSTPVAMITGPGSMSAQQAFVFKDLRTGASDIPAKDSGFKITRSIAEPAAGTREITTTKAGNAGTANGVTVTAGAGNVSRTQPV